MVEFRRSLRPITDQVAAIACACKATIPDNDTAEFDVKVGMLLVDTIADALNLPEECVERLR